MPNESVNNRIPMPQRGYTVPGPPPKSQSSEFTLLPRRRVGLGRGRFISLEKRGQCEFYAGTRILADDHRLDHVLAVVLRQ